MIHSITFHVSRQGGLDFGGGVEIEGGINGPDVVHVIISFTWLNREWVRVRVINELWVLFGRLKAAARMVSGV